MARTAGPNQQANGKSLPMASKSAMGREGRRGPAEPAGVRAPVAHQPRELLGRQMAKLPMTTSSQLHPSGLQPQGLQLPGRLSVVRGAHDTLGSSQEGAH